MTRFDLSVNGDVYTGNRTVPEVMIPFTMTDQITSICSQYFAYSFLISSICNHTTFAEAAIIHWAAITLS